MDMGKNVLRKPTRRRLADLFENRVAQIVEQHPAEPCQRIGSNQRNGDLNTIGHPGGHAIDGALEGKRHDQRCRFGQQHQEHCRDDARAQRRLAGRP